VVVVVSCVSPSHFGQPPASRPLCATNRDTATSCISEETSLERGRACAPHLSGYTGYCVRVLMEMAAGFGAGVLGRRGRRGAVDWCRAGRPRQDQRPARHPADRPASGAPTFHKTI